MKEKKIPFNRPYMTGKELSYIAEAHANGCLAGDGPFTKKCQGWIEKRTGCTKALLTHSCTAALEMAAILTDIQPGDEVIMPSYTFVSTANAFALRGARIVFADIRPDTLNLDETKLESIKHAIKINPNWLSFFISISSTRTTRKAQRTTKTTSRCALSVDRCACHCLETFCFK